MLAELVERVRRIERGVDEFTSGSSSLMRGWLSRRPEMGSDLSDWAARLWRSSGRILMSPRLP